MARVRLLRPGFFTNEQLTECSAYARLLFAGLWCWADREGRIEDRPRRLRAEILPYDEVDGETLIAELTSKGFIARYEADGIRVLQIVNFRKHQNPHPREVPSKLPEQKEQLQGAAEPRQAAAGPSLGATQAIPSHEKAWKSRADSRTLGLPDSREELPLPPAAPAAAEAKPATPPALAAGGEATATGRAGTATSPPLPKPKPKPDTDPRFAPLKAVWLQEFERAHPGCEYRWGVADATGVHRIIAVDPEELRRRAKRSFAAVGYLRCGTLAKLTSNEVWNQLAGPAPPSGKRTMAEVSDWDDPNENQKTLRDVRPH